MNTANRIRALKLQRYRDTLKDDATAKAAFDALDAAAAALADVEQRRASLAETNRFTAQGIFEELKPFRARHAEALRAAEQALQTAAEKVVPRPAAVEAPPDGDRILAHYLAQPAARQQQMRLAALAGRDDDLARTLLGERHSRYVELTPEIRDHMVRRVAPADVPAEVGAQLEVLVLAKSVVSETLETLNVTE